MRRSFLRVVLSAVLVLFTVVSAGASIYPSKQFYKTPESEKYREIKFHTKTSSVFGNNFCVIFVRSIENWWKKGGDRKINGLWIIKLEETTPSESPWIALEIQIINREKPSEAVAEGVINLNQRNLLTGEPRRSALKAAETTIRIIEAESLLISK